MGGAPQLLPLQATEAAWSPDRQTIAVAGENALTFVRGANITHRTVMPMGTLVRRLQWSPDGGNVTFALNNVRLALDALWLLNPLSERAQPIAQTELVGRDQSFGAWTKDGRYYVFAAGSPEVHDIWAISNPAGSRRPDLIQPLRVTNGPMNWVWPRSGNTTGEIYALGETRRAELVNLSPETGEWRPYLE